MPHALIVGDDVDMREKIAVLCQAERFSVAFAGGLREATVQIARQRPDIAFVDLYLPEGTGLGLFGEIGSWKRLDIVLITGNATLESAVDALRLGAADYLTKPVSLRRVQHLLARIGRPVEPGGERFTTGSTGLPSGPPPGRPSHRPSGRPGHFGGMLGAATVMQKLYQHIDRVSPTEATVLLLGESGTGKEIAAQTIHDLSSRRRLPFVPMNCGAISPQLIESEIFGHEKGSFTGADRQHRGYFERANGGTLFLDKITEMPVELQVQLLRVLETGAFMRIGGNQELATDVRIIASSNRDPEEAIADGKLRLDLYHRLNVFPLVIPPLRDRGSDPELLAQHFLEELNAAHATVKELSANALGSLNSYRWPGNVRELRNHVQRAYVLSDQVIDASALAPALTTRAPVGLALAIPVGTSLAEVDRKLIFATMELCGGVKKRAADILGISLKTLYNRLEEYAMQ